MFFQGEDFWSVPADPAAAVNRVANETAGGAAAAAQTLATVDVNATGPDQPPYYALLQFPGQPAARFSLSTALVAANRPNLAAFMSVSSDPEDYGTLRVLQMPPNNQPSGPGLIANQILANKDVADALFSLGRNGRKLTFGNLLLLPVGEGLLAVQPLYVSQQGAGGFPTLQRIIVSFGAQTASGASLGQALTALLAQTDPTAPPPDVPADDDPGGADDAHPVADRRRGAAGRPGRRGAGRRRGVHRRPGGAAAGRLRRVRAPAGPAARGAGPAQRAAGRRLRQRTSTARSLRGPGRRASGAVAAGGQDAAVCTSRPASRTVCAATRGGAAR